MVGRVSSYFHYQTVYMSSTSPVNTLEHFEAAGVVVEIGKDPSVSIMRHKLSCPTASLDLSEGDCREGFGQNERIGQAMKGHSVGAPR